MNYIFSCIFLIFLTLWGAIIPIIYTPAFLLNNSKLADHGAKIWARFGLWTLKKLCGVNYRVVGIENLPDEPVIIACKHQSMWETMVMHILMDRPVYTYKKELERIPFYGWYIRVMSGIKLNRKGGAGALKSLIKQGKNYISKGQNIVIFPQGTRVPVGGNSADYPYRPGIAALYLSCNVKVIPAALDSGVFWPKHKIKKHAGTITLQFLEAINPGLTKAEFLKKLEEVTDKHSDELCQNAKAQDQ